MGLETGPPSAMLPAPITRPATVQSGTEIGHGDRPHSRPHLPTIRIRQEPLAPAHRRSAQHPPAGGRASEGCRSGRLDLEQMGRLARTVCLFFFFLLVFGLGSFVFFFLV